MTVAGPPVSETPWKAGRFDAHHGARQLLFGRMYEDTAIEEAAFRSSTRVFCIASAGCMALKLALEHEVTAVDINPVQLEYARHRAAGGSMQLGTAERIVGFGRRVLVPFGWRRATLRRFLELDRPVEQVAFWNHHLNTAGFRLATDVLFSFAGLRWLYAPQFLTALPPQFGRVMRARLERCWRTHANRTNPYARALLLGGVSETPARNGNGEIRFVCADAASFLESSPAGSFSAFTLSNILDGAPDHYRQRLFAAVRRAGTPDAVVVRRSFAEPGRESATNLAGRDRSILWGVVDVRPADALRS
jgi:hypothetical protein